LLFFPTLEVDGAKDPIASSTSTEICRFDSWKEEEAWKNHASSSPKPSLLLNAKAFCCSQL